MVNPKDPNKRYYFKKLDILSKKRFLEYLSNKNREIFLWIKGYEEKDLEAFRVIQINKAGNLIKLEKRTHFLKKIFKSLLADNDVFIKVTRGKDYYFFQGHLSHKEKSTYSLAIQEDIYKGERRKNYRLNSSVFVKINFQYQNKLFSGHDISAGGCSFIIPEELKQEFPNDTILKQGIISLNRDKFIIPKCKIIKVSEVTLKDQPEKKFFRLGVEFINLPKSTEEEMRRLINTEARGLEIRQKFNLKG